MAVIIDMERPSNCMWTEKCVGYKCPLLNDENCCNLQDCKDEWTWQDQYAGCPLSDVVYCKDCINFLNNHICLHLSRYGTVETKPDDYCSYGEKL